MAGPSYGWLSTGFPSLQELAGMPAPAPAGGPATIALGAPPPAPPPMLAIPGAPTPAPPQGPPPPPAAPPPTAGEVAAGPPTPIGPPNTPQVFGPPDDRTGMVPGPMREPPPAAPRQPPPPDVQFARVGGGAVPAHEQAIRGPKQNALLEHSFEAPLEAATNIDFRTQLQAEREQLEYDRQAEDALKRQDSLARMQAQRAAEMERMRVDYDESIAKLGQMHLDDNRWWAKKSTGDKLGTIALVFLGGIASLGNGGQNLAYNATLKEIDDDLAAQKFDYMAGMDRAKGAQNAFAMAMEQYKDQDAAWNAARAAALDFAAAKTAGLAAEWKGTESANAADEFRAKLLMERDRTAAAGLQFVPARQAPGMYKMVIRGQEIPGLVSEKDAQKYAVERGVQPAENVDIEMVKGGIGAARDARQHTDKQQDKISEETRFIAEKLQAAGIPQARAMAERAMVALNKSPGGKTEAVARMAARTVPVVGEGLGNAVMGEDANEREQAYNDFMSAAMKATYGNVTASEEVRAQKSYGSTGNPEARRRSIQAVLNTLEQMEKTPKAGVSTAAQQRFDEQRASAEGQPKLVPKGAEKGW